MIAEAFIDFIDFGNIFMIVAGVVLGLVLVVFAVAAADSSIGPLPFFGFALFFFIGLGIVFPHMSTVNGRHHEQVFADLPRAYGSELEVVNASVRDHWVDFQLPSCGAQTYRYPNLRLLDGEYRFATAVIRKDKHGGESTDYVAIRPENLSGICQTAILVS